MSTDNTPHPGSSQRAIAESAGVATSAINQVVKSMLEEGYLRKEADPCDKRNSMLYLTEKGTHGAARLFGKPDAADDAITAMPGADREVELIALVGSTGSGKYYELYRHQFAGNKT